ncbi:MAG TPA: transketolase C-terminal domain-containing protein, partial [Trueperaceae bacterium]
DGRFVKPLDSNLLRAIADAAAAVVTVEDHTVLGGLGSAVLEDLAEGGKSVPVSRLGIHDVTVPHGDPVAQHEELGYGPEAIGRRLDELGAVRVRVGRVDDAVEAAG